VGLRLRRPSDSDLAKLLDRCRGEALTYAPVGGSLAGTTPRGLHRHDWSRALPHTAFDRAAAAIEDWAVHRGAGLSVLAEGAIAVGTNVAMSAPLPVGFVDVTCRVVAVVDEPDRRGFAYGTLPVHPETGEEAFLVVRTDHDVRFTVTAISAPRHPAARLAPPLTNRLQDQAVRRYLDAMSRLVAD
jgi:uncharacterized protein (UPF0548 family)